MKVQFHSVDEFLAEITRDVDRLDRKILRVSIMQRYSHPFLEISMVSTAVVGGVVVRLDRRIDSCFFCDETELARLRQRAKEQMEAVETSARNLGLEVRAGIDIQD